MAIAYGISPTGFYAKPLTVISDEIDAGIQSILGNSAGTDSGGKLPTASMAGQLKALMVDGIAAMWDLAEATVASLDPSKASGVFQDAIGAITGTVRDAARSTIATGTCIGDPNISLPAGRAATIGGTTSRFSTPTGFQIATGTAWVPSGIYGPGNLRFNLGNTYQCLGSGIAGPSGPSGTAQAITDGGTSWKYLGPGIGYVHIPFIADAPGPVGVATGSLNSIATPVSGWNALTNLIAGVAGVNRETDAQYRVRRSLELATAGNTTADAIRANILNVNQGSSDPNHSPATSCTVFYNDTDYADPSSGLPPHSVEILVQDGTTADIALAIWQSVGAGTQTYGNRSDTVYDSQGNPQVVNWSRPTTVSIWVTANGRYDASQWPVGSDSVVAQSLLSALLTATAAWPIGVDVRTSPLIGAFMRGPAGTTGGLAIVPADPSANPVTGLLEIDNIFIGSASGPTGSASVVIGSRQVASFDTSRCVVTATVEAP